MPIHVYPNSPLTTLLIQGVSFGEYNRRSYIIPKIVIIEFIRMKWGKKPNYWQNCETLSRAEDTKGPGHCCNEVWFDLPHRNDGTKQNNTIFRRKQTDAVQSSMLFMFVKLYCNHLNQCIEEKMSYFLLLWFLSLPPKHSCWFVSFMRDHCPRKI